MKAVRIAQYQGKVKFTEKDYLKFDEVDTVLDLHQVDDLAACEDA